MQAEQEGSCGSGDPQGSAHSSSGSLSSQVIVSLSARRCEEEEGGGASVPEPQLQDGGRACLPADSAPQHPGGAQVRSSTSMLQSIRGEIAFWDRWGVLLHYLEWPTGKELVLLVLSSSPGSRTALTATCRRRPRRARPTQRSAATPTCPGSSWSRPHPAPPPPSPSPPVPAAKVSGPPDHVTM